MNENSSLNLNLRVSTGFWAFLVCTKNMGVAIIPFFKYNNKAAPPLQICNLLQFYD